MIDAQDKKIRNLSFLISFFIVAVMSMVNLYDHAMHLELYKFGVLPRHLSGLWGIILSPFIHSTHGYSHLLNNFLPTFILAWLLFYSFRTVATKVFFWSYIVTGVLVWLFGRESYHVGMSGVIYALTSFLIVSGFLIHNMRVAGVSLLVMFLYGSLIWGMFPTEPHISWEGHLFGFIVGAALAVVYRKKGPKPQVYRYEVEEELEKEAKKLPKWAAYQHGKHPYYNRHKTSSHHHKQAHHPNYSYQSTHSGPTNVHIDYSYSDKKINP